MKKSHTKGRKYRPATATRSLRLPVTVWEGLDTLANEDGISRNQEALLALIAWLDKRNVKVEGL